MGSFQFLFLHGADPTDFPATAIWVFPKIRVPQKWMVKIIENPIKMDDLGVPLCLETPILLH